MSRTKTRYWLLCSSSLFCKPAFVPLLEPTEFHFFRKQFPEAAQERYTISIPHTWEITQQSYIYHIALTWMVNQFME
jgi:hypothetical protein